MAILQAGIRSTASTLSGISEISHWCGCGHGVRARARRCTGQLASIRDSVLMSPRPSAMTLSCDINRLLLSIRRCRSKSFWESVVHKWQQSACALGALVVVSGFAGQPAYADGSVSSLRMGYGARNAAEFAQFQSVIQQYN